MNWGHVYGQTLVNVPAPELVEGGYILPPKVVVKQLDMVQDKMKVWSRDCDFLMKTIDDQQTDKVLVCARTTKQIIGLLTDSDFRTDVASRGYSWMTITSKTGAIIDGKKVNREVFFDTLNAWGKILTKSLWFCITLFCPKVSTSTDWRVSFSSATWTTLVSVSLSVV